MESSSGWSRSIRCASRHGAPVDHALREVRRCVGLLRSRHLPVLMWSLAVRFHSRSRTYGNRRRRDEVTAQCVRCGASTPRRGTPPSLSAVRQRGLIMGCGPPRCRGAREVTGRSADGRRAVVVGAGPNGLVAAITLARAGWDVTVYEAARAPGGGMRSEELTVPGAIHDVCSAIHPLAVGSPAFREIAATRFARRSRTRVDPFRGAARSSARWGPGRSAPPLGRRDRSRGSGMTARRIVACSVRS